MQQPERFGAEGVAVPNGGQLLPVIECAVKHVHRTVPAASARYRRRPGKHSERLQLGALRYLGRFKRTLCRQLCKMQVAESGCQYERVIGGLSKEASRAQPIAAVAGGQVNL
jgi:hypothetical protein